MNATDNLPAWASRDETGMVTIDPATAYPHYLTLLDLPADKYGAEVARRCAIEDMKALCGIPLRVKITKCEDWALRNLSGTDTEAQQGANEFGKHYDALIKRRAAQAMAAGNL